MATTIEDVPALNLHAQIANGKFTLKSRMLHLIVTVSDSSYNGRNGTRALVSAGFTIYPAYLICLPGQFYT